MTAEVTGTGRSRARLIIVGMIFIAVVINYLDRSNISITVPEMKKAFGFNNTEIEVLKFRSMRWEKTDFAGAQQTMNAFRDAAGHISSVVDSTKISATMENLRLTSANAVMTITLAGGVMARAFDRISKPCARVLSR